jgi:ERCC4-type nuclease
MDSTITVDTNAAEDRLYGLVGEQFTAHDGDCLRRERLDLGDALITHGDQTLVVERKTWADWCASITDGRYREQKARFAGSLAKEGARLVYLIEHPEVVPLRGKTGGMSNKAANAALLKTAHRDGYTIRHTRDTEDSAAYVVYLFEQLRSGGLELDSLRATYAHASAAGGAHKRKRDNLEDPQALYRAMLAVVPGMSAAKAAAVAEKYASLRALLDAHIDDVSNVKVGARRLGAVVAKRLGGLLQ